ncbi:uncharacterized protein [Porites lutea]|uniref:uncharacterized protein n=1 Tax=Porites lutea TaxID=51062 RepID=UPI003CC5B29E
MERKQKRKLNIKQRFSCGVGSVLNEIFRQMFISFTIIFFMQVIRLPASQAGLALLIGQVSDAILSPVTGYLGDSVQIPVVSKKIGRRKSWHLVGTIMMACGTPLLFNRCLVCTDFPDISWLPAVYYICIVVVVCMSYNIVEINHLSITYSAADTIQEGTALNAIRTVFSFLSGLYVYVVAWGLLGQDGAEHLGPENVTQFAHLAGITTGTGVFFQIIFYIGTKEAALRPLSSLMDPAGVGGLFEAGKTIYSAVFETAEDVRRKTSAIALSFVDILMSSMRSEEDDIEKATGEVRDLEDEIMRKTSLLQRFTQALFAFNTPDSSTEEEPHVSEVKDEKPIVKPGSDLIEHVKRLDSDRKQSLVLRVINGLIHKTQDESQLQESVVSTNGGHTELDNSSTESFETDNFSDSQLDSSETGETEIMEEHEADSEVSGNDELHGATTKKERRRKKGISMFYGGFNTHGIYNSGYQDDQTYGIERGVASEKEATDALNRSEIISDHFNEEMKTIAQSDTIPDPVYKENYSIKGCDQVLEFPEMGVVSLAKTESEKKVVFVDDEHGSEKETAEDGSNDITDKPTPATSSTKRKQKTIKDWLKNPRVYKVAIVVTCSRLVQDAVYAYLPLYLTERLGFGKQSIAYFPLVLLVSAAVGSTISDKLNTKLGSKWTYLIASLSVIGPSVYCYFQTPDLKEATYAPVILIGCGMSIMYVIALTLCTEVIGDDKETSGSVFAIVVFIGRLSSGALFMTIQEFYPEDGSVSSASDYVRHVFSIVPAILALAGSLMVLVLQSSSLCCSKEGFSANQDTADEVSEASTTSFDVVVVP